MRPARLLLSALLLFTPSGPIPAAASEPAGIAPAWLLSEFDWGDVRPVVDESVDVATDLYCAARFGKRCSTVLAHVEGEELLAKFAFFRGLYRIRLLTPDIEISNPAPGEQVAAGEEILRRVWKHFVDFVTRHQGAPLTEQEFPRPSKTDAGTHVTHTWRLPDQDIRIGVGRRRGGGFFAVAEFVDPEREAAARASADTPQHEGSSPPPPAD